MKTILYTAGCPLCVIVKKFLERNNVNFKEVDISKDKKAREVMIQCLFVYIGHKPRSHLAEQIGAKLNEKGEVVINNHSATNIKGFFAAGDVTNVDWKQAIIGVSQGVTASYYA